jgi:hypothetical protein
MDHLGKGSCCCLFTAGLEAYHELNLTLQTLTEHDTTELHTTELLAAITETLESIVKLRAARDKAIKRFEEQGNLFTVVPVAKEEEAPAVQDATEEPAI